MSTYYNNTYSYTSGNYSSTTTIVNGTAYTNNITTIGGGCSSDNSCTDGYSLYFPCLKSITRGQNVCFEFYVGDNANQDELDLRDLDAFSLVLSGAFGCEYGTYTYPEDIVSLQYEKYKNLWNEDFNVYPSNVCSLTAKYIDEDFNDIQPNVNGQVGHFYIGTEVTLTSDDTPTHIFIGWGVPHDNDGSDMCSTIIDGVEYTYDDVNDYIVSTDKTYSIVLSEDTIVYAIYRERKKYSIKVNYNNRHSHFEVYYNGERHYLSDKYRDSVTVLEGYHFKAVCIPNEGILSNSDFYYCFDKWNDGYEYQARIMLADDSNPFINSDKDTILLLAQCYDTLSKDLNIVNDVDEVSDDFSYQYPENHEIYAEYEYNEYKLSDNIVEKKNVTISYKNDNGLLFVSNGYLKTNLIDAEDGIRVDTTLIAKTDSTITFEVNEESQTFTLEAGNTQEYKVLFRNCNYSSVKMTVDGSVYVDEFGVDEEIIENKGLVKLCLTSEDTAKMYTGSLYATGAITVNGDTYGISKTLMGSINNLKTISII